MVDSEPRVSMAGSLRMMALLLAISCIARASEIVTTAGRPSGMMATAMETADLNAVPRSSSASRCAMSRVATAITATKTLTKRPKISSWIIRLVFVSSSFDTMPLMRPISAKSPVPITMPVPSPSVTLVAEKAKFLRSPRPDSKATGSVCLATGMLSPVSIASSVWRRDTSIMRTSAGTWSPFLILTMSPGTISAAWISTCAPPRITMALGASMFLMASAAFSALPSWTIPMVTLMMTTAQMRATSFHSSRIAERMVAAIRM
mmetsp:Transcript_14213/g.28303  ORF Transcript_14213/g.28303 Transcript_14213/m.28303 type:complete len:262 (+) Transcript_14213:601-1386(+)